MSGRSHYEGRSVAPQRFDVRTVYPLLVKAARLALDADDPLSRAKFVFAAKLAWHEAEGEDT